MNIGSEPLYHCGCLSNELGENQVKNTGLKKFNLQSFRMIKEVSSRTFGTFIESHGCLAPPNLPTALHPGIPTTQIRATSHDPPADPQSPPKSTSARAHPPLANEDAQTMSSRHSFIASSTRWHSFLRKGLLSI